MPSFNACSTYSRLDPISSQNYHYKRYHIQSLQSKYNRKWLYRVLLLIALFIFLFIFVFIFTISLSLLIIGNSSSSSRRNHVLLIDEFVESTADNYLTNDDDYRTYFSPLSRVISNESTLLSSNKNRNHSQNRLSETWTEFADRISEISQQDSNNKRATFIDSFAKSLLNLSDFRYRYTANLTRHKCLHFTHVRTEAKSLNLVILIHSAVDHFAHRQLLRQTWLNAKMATNYANLVYAFILGESESNTTLQSLIDQEQQLYGDIVQANFIDSYHNLTYKHLVSLRWAVEFECSTLADLIFKVDDDAFVDTYAVIDFFRGNRVHRRGSSLSLSPSPLTSLLACSLFPDTTVPKRAGKWRLPRRLYPFETFPAYCSGVGYFITPDVAQAIVHACNKLPNKFPLIPIDDVFITGMVRSVLRPQVRPLPLNAKYVYDVAILRRWLDKQDNDGEQCPSGFLVGDIGNEADRGDLTIALWNATHIAWRLYFAGEAKECHRLTYQLTSL